MEEEKKEELKGEEKPQETAEATEEVEEAEAEEPVEEEAEETLEEKEAAETKAEEAPAPVEEETRPPREEKAEKEEEFVEERVYSIPLSKAWIMPPRKRAPKAMRMIRSFVTKHMKLEAKKEGEEEEEAPKRLIISNEVNERIWRRGIEKPLRTIRIRAAKDKEGNVTVFLAEGD